MLNDWLNFWHKLFCFLGFGAQKAEPVMDSLWVPVIYIIGNPQEAPQTGTLNSHPHYSGHPSWISQSHQKEQYPFNAQMRSRFPIFPHLSHTTCFQFIKGSPIPSPVAVSCPRPHHSSLYFCRSLVSDFSGSSFSPRWYTCYFIFTDSAIPQDVLSQKRMVSIQGTCSPTMQSLINEEGLYASQKRSFRSTLSPVCVRV